MTKTHRQPHSSNQRWQHADRTDNSPSCKEYSRSKVTSHMPLKAVIFHRNFVQSSRRVHGAAVGQARLRAGQVLLMLPGGLSSPGPTLSDAENRAAEKVPPLPRALSSPYRAKLLSPHPHKRMMERWAKRGNRRNGRDLCFTHGGYMALFDSVNGHLGDNWKASAITSDDSLNLRQASLENASWRDVSAHNVYANETADFHKSVACLVKEVGSSPGEWKVVLVSIISPCKDGNLTTGI